jgi:glutamate-1-semialdehyde 2,1-aminomutase
LEQENPYPRLESLGSRLEQGLIRAASAANLPVRVNRVGSMFTLFFTGQDVTDFDSAKICDTNRFNHFFHTMLDQGVYLPASQFEAAFISAAHTEADIEKTVEAATQALTT